MTSTSEGPAGMSMATMASLFCRSILAAVTYWLPGPKILSTCSQGGGGHSLLHLLRCASVLCHRWTRLHCEVAEQQTRKAAQLFSKELQPGFAQYGSSPGRIPTSGCQGSLGPALTLGQDSVPQAMAATACAPPAFSTWVTPAFLAAHTTSGVMLPSGLGGVASTMVLHPAIWAGTVSMRALEGSTAVPPGTYTPTAPAGNTRAEVSARNNT